MHAVAGPRWFVGTTRPQQEFVAASSLRSAGFTVFLPCSRHWVRQRFKLLRRAKASSALFPGYLFVQFDPKVSGWFEPIHRANGMRAVLHDVDGIPTPVPPNVIETLQKAEQAGEFDATRSRPRFRTGDMVEIKSGPLTGLLGKIRKADSRDRVRLLVGALAVDIDGHAVAAVR